ncbi:MAG: phage tail protein [Rhodospirillaceae bacterium]|nr:phage tail protein [Rhodospirillaceae bacterium]
MSIGIKVQIDFSAFSEALDALGDKHFRAAGMIAVNDTLRQANKAAVSAIAKAGSIKVADVRKRLRAIKATRENLTGILRASKYALPLVAFSARQVKAGVTAREWGQRRTYKGAFIATMKTGHRGVFKRVGDDRLPIRQLWGPGVGHVMRAPDVRADLEALIRERLPINLKRQIERRLRVISGKAKLSAASQRKLR